MRERKIAKKEMAIEVKRMFTFEEREGEGERATKCKLILVKLNWTQNELFKTDLFFSVSQK